MSRFAIRKPYFIGGILTFCLPGTTVNVMARKRVVMLAGITLLRMALQSASGSESCAPLARAVVRGLRVSTWCPVFVVPAAFLLACRNRPVLQEAQH